MTEALDEHEVGSISASDRSTLERAWRAMPVWPEVVPSIARLKTRYVVAPHTILSLAAVAHSSKIAGLDWDAIISCDALEVTKTNPDSYLGAARTIGFDVDRICYVAAHTSDLDVASGFGLRTAFVQPRLDEYGERGTDRGGRSFRRVRRRLCRPRRPARLTATAEGGELDLSRRDRNGTCRRCRRRDASA